MAEYIEREAALKEVERSLSLNEAYSRIASRIIAADVVEVVRCEKCRFARNPLPDHGARRCAKTSMFHPNDWHCPNGERMDGE